MDDFSAYLSQTLPQVLNALSGSDVAEFRLEEDGLRLHVHRAVAGTSDPVEPEPEIEEALILGPPVDTIRSTIVGTFYRAETPGAQPLAAEGSQVDEGMVVGIVEALSVLTEIKSGVRGTVQTVRATDGQPVEYGQPLFDVLLDG